jgi:hypothetical protein
MKAIFDPDTPGGLVFCIACRADSRSITTDDMVKEYPATTQNSYSRFKNLWTAEGGDVQKIVSHGL